jgi:hypothetical protein
MNLSQIYFLFDGSLVDKSLLQKIHKEVKFFFSFGDTRISIQGLLYHLNHTSSLCKILKGFFFFLFFWSGMEGKNDKASFQQLTLNMIQWIKFVLAMFIK